MAPQLNQEERRRRLRRVCERQRVRAGRRSWFAGACCGWHGGRLLWEAAWHGTRTHAIMHFALPKTSNSASGTTAARPAPTMCLNASTKMSQR